MKKKSKKPSIPNTVSPGLANHSAAVDQPELDPPKTPGPSNFPIIGIGASAGGLEAMELFFKAVPKDCGLGFVVVQHLDPTHKGMLAELLQHKTTMPVSQIQDRMKVEPNHVYVIPPDRDLSILHGVLQLLEPAAPRGLRLPIDFFFRSLAEDQQDRAIGVILSGMGSDGCLGIGAIKEKAGMIFVQDPKSAKFDSMPRSAINTGLVDLFVPPEELPGKILAFLKNIPIQVPTHGDIDLGETEQSGLDKVIVLLRAQTGNDFSLYKRTTIYRRIERRMGLHRLSKLNDYIRYLRETPQECQLLFKELLIGVTSFFRDPDAWEQLAGEVFPVIFSAHPNGGLLRAWVPGCSTGEEAFSLAILFKEATAKLRPTQPFSLQIFATDLDKDAIEKARLGVYPINIGADVSEERLHRFFIQDEHGLRVAKEIREMVIFAPQNLIMDPPFTKLDLLTCRNLLIYLTPELQKKIIPLFHYSLNPGGFLMLGSAETIGGATDRFAPIHGKNRIYQRLNISPRIDDVDFPPGFTRARPSNPGINTESARPNPVTTNLQSLTDQWILKEYAPPAVLVNDKGDILYVNGKTGKYLEPAAGKANWNLLAMAREGLTYPLNQGFRQAVSQKAVVVLEKVELGTNGGTLFARIVIQPISEPKPLSGLLMVVFMELAHEKKGKPKKYPSQDLVDKSRVVALEQELQQTNEELHTTREEMQTSVEELKSTNEELQSTNEELTTSQEEMQSMNEELQTVNHEFQAKINELMLASDDMKNLLNSTDMAILFLDEDLKVRRFTTQTTKIIKLIPGDAGRLITDIVTDLNYGELAEDCREVLRTLLVQERQVSSRDGRWFTVRIIPYRTQDNRVSGVVITFNDITLSRGLSEELRKVHLVLEEQFSRQTQQLDEARRQIISTIDPPAKEKSMKGQIISTIDPPAKEKSMEKGKP